MNGDLDVHQMLQILIKSELSSSICCLQDAVAQLLEHKEENPRVVPTRFLSD